jgi:hypothetical protein
MIADKNNVNAGIASSMIDKRIKKLFRFNPNTPDKEVLATIKKATTRVCKPCWEIKYCPFGPFVEKFPLLPLTREEAEEEFPGIDSSEYPEKIPEPISDMGCTVFGHVCPVFFISEEVTETSEHRRRGRYIPFHIKIRVVRRDNYTCQICGKHLLDNEVEFDHVIPISKGGSSEEHNIRLTCYRCNQDKNDRFEI